MTKSELVDKIAKKTTSLTKKQAEMVLETILESIKKSLASGEKVEIRGFGNFRVRKREARKARNPRTGVIVEVMSKKVPFFKSGKELKEMVKKNEGGQKK
jgi:integration host factor beta subunit